MPDAETLRVQVRLSDLEHPELHAALNALPVRSRAERLRQLALLGWRALASASHPTAMSAGAETASAADTSAAPDPRRAQLLAALRLDD
ncbi:MAG: hypothetical protein VBE63_28970 [Lamprobacter sp.]|uniref:hypothetical protein n=1 Tax=Lamprobacter sp. TaxID=3100796 RepID=UPI002B261C4C|nr:hypothetical protein [Lamprobacter sp.]MEA3643929.1 hypothetical protein [Lamprobacter sp.]